MTDFFDNFKNPIHSFLELEEICESLSLHLELTFQIEKRNFLMAIAGVESSFGSNCGPRFEPAYAPGGIYFGNESLKQDHHLYGALASCSFGPWQMLSIVARELGFTGHPLELSHGDVSGPFVIKKINQFSRNGANSVERILEAWNHGTWRDPATNQSLKYIAQFWVYYNQLTEKTT